MSFLAQGAYSLVAGELVNIMLVSVGAWKEIKPGLLQGCGTWAKLSDVCLLREGRFGQRDSLKRAGGQREAGVPEERHRGQQGQAL